MSMISQTRSFERLNAESIERGLQSGRRLRSQAFAAALRSLFSRQKPDRPRDETVRLPDCAAAA